MLEGLLVETPPNFDQALKYSAKDFDHSQVGLEDFSKTQLNLPNEGDGS